MTKLPIPVIKRRSINSKREQQAIAAGFDALVARIIAGRPFLETLTVSEMVAPKLKSLDHPHLLADMEPAVKRLIKALQDKEVIGIETDHDCDGQTSHAVIYTTLIEFFNHPKERVRSYIGHRLKEGYGLSELLTQRILADSPRPTLIITADNGSSDEPRIAQLKQVGIDVIVTDHHEIPAQGIPQSAYAVINPTRSDSAYPDKCIAGCMVAWLYMAAVRQQLISLTQSAIPSLASCLDFVAVGTIADCVSIARSHNNRAVVSYGMKLIQQGTRACWRVLLPGLSSPLSSQDLGFKIGPLLNSDGRLACAFGSVSFLLSKDEEEAAQWVLHLREQNAQRKVIQEKVTELALNQALMQCAQNKQSLCLFLEQGHAGVHGISASRLKDWFGRPVIIFCPKTDEPDLLTGSARSIDGLHLKNILQEVEQCSPGLLERFGGHQAAAGVTLKRTHFALFAQWFEKIVCQKVSADMIGPVLFTDGEFPIEKMNLTFVKTLLTQLEPFGREFDPPSFEVTGKLTALNPVGQSGIHVRLKLWVKHLNLELIWFNAREHDQQPWPVDVGEEVQVVFAPRIEHFRDQIKLCCQVIHAKKG